MTTAFRLAPCITALAGSAMVAAPAMTQQATIPIRQVGPAVSTDSGVIKSLYGFRALRDKHVVVNDFIARRILFFDSTLVKYTVVADTTTGGPSAYGTYTTGLLAYAAETTLVVDRSSTAFVMIDPTGKVGSIMSPPKASDLFYMSSGLFDAKGRIFYRGYRRPLPNRTATPVAPPAANGVPQISSSGVDSAPILRADFDSRTVDTVAMMKIPMEKSVMIRVPMGASGGVSGFGFPVVNPLPLTDDWTVLSDGTVAIVRAQDYHIDWVAVDGKTTSTPKMPFEWKRITMEEKEQMIDSIKKEYDKLPEAQKSMTMSDGTRFARPLTTVEPSELPDYFPPVRAGQVRADPEGNVWILPSTSTLATGGLLFDVVNRAGEVFERVQLPPNRNLAGFGPDGTVYLSTPPGALGSGVRLERAQVIRPVTAPVKP